MTHQLLKLLATDKQSGIRYTVAINKSISVDILRELSADPDAGVRWGVTQNPATPVDILKVLAKDKDTRVADSAKKAAEER